MEQTRQFKWKRLPLLILGLLALAVFLGKAAFDLYWFYQVKWQPLALIVERAASPLEPASGRLYDVERAASPFKTVDVVISPQRTLDSRLVLLVKRIKGDAAKAALAKGDVIFEVNGSPITRWDDTLTKRTAEGVTFTVMQQETPKQVHCQLRGAKGSPEFLETFGISTHTFYLWFALGALGLSMLGMGLLVYLKSETQPATLLLLIGITLTPFMGILIQNLPFLQGAPLLFIVPAMNFSASFLLHFLLIFPQKKKIVEKFGRAVYFIYIPSIVSVLAICLIYAAMGKRGDVGQIISISTGLLFLLYGILGFIALLHSYKRTTSPVVKGQTRTLLFGFGVVFAPTLIYFIFGIFSDFILKKGPPPYVIASAIPALLLAIPLSFGYAILRQGMLDVNFVIKKSVSYFAITVMAVGLYLGIVMGVGKGLLALTGGTSQTLTIGATLLVAVLFAPMQNWMRRVIDRKFYRERYDAHELLAQFSRDLPSMMELPDILGALTERLTNSLHPRSLSILLSSPSGEEFIVAETTEKASKVNPLKRDESRLIKQLQETRQPFVCYQLDAVAQSLTEADIALLRAQETVLCVPMLVQDRLVGVLNLGFKRSELPYNPEDVTLLRTVAGNAAIAIENARLSAQKVEQERRIQAEKMATLVTLAGGVAHEINNPMDAILGSVQRILRFPEDPKKVVESAQSAQEGSRRCKEIVGKLLKYARQFSDEFAALEVNQVVEDTVALLAHQLKLENISIQMQFSPGLKVQGNFNELSQVITNLLTNAKDAIVAGRAAGKEAGVIIVRTAIENNEILFEVVDNGIGIEEEHLGKLFDPFFTTKPVGKGTGLGLSICQGIVEKHHGRIEVESKVGEGATFRVFLPIAFSNLEKV